MGIPKLTLRDCLWGVVMVAAMFAALVLSGCAATPPKHDPLQPRPNIVVLCPDPLIGGLTKDTLNGRPVIVAMCRPLAKARKGI